MIGGNGLIFTEFEIERALLPEFRVWHSREHIPERLEVPGVRSSRRYGSLENDRLFIGYYRADSADVFAGPDYRAVMARSSDQTKRIMTGLRGTRFVGDIVREDGEGYGGLACRMRISIDSEGDPRLLDWYDATSPAILAASGMVRMMLAKPRRNAENVSDPRWVLLIEGADAAALEVLPKPNGAASDLFRLEHLFA